MKKENTNENKNKKVKSAIAWFMAGAFVVSMGSSDENISTVKEEARELSETLEIKVGELDKANNELKTLNKEVKKLEEKLKEAQPYLDDVVRKGRVKEDRSMIAVKLKKDIADKLKAYSYTKGLTVTEVVEDIINALFSNKKLNKRALEAYNDKYKKKNREE